MKQIRDNTLFALLMTFPAISFSAQLTMTDFLKQVNEKNQSMVASQLTIDGTSERSNEGKLLFRPSFFAQAQSAIDKKPTTNVNAQGDRTDYNYISAGIQEQFNFGLTGKLSYNLSHTKIYNASPAFLPINDFNDGIASLELSQSLWRNFLGKEANSQADIITSQSAATKHSEEYKMKATLAQAESLYWSLSQIRKVVKVQKESLERAQKIRNWTQGRLNNGLAESSDFLQADANFKAREYELKSSTQDLRNLQRAFNSMRGLDAETIDEELEAVDSSKLKSLQLPSKAELREDTKAAIELQKISKASADLSIEKNKPTLEVYGTYALNGRDVVKSEAISNSFKTNHDTRAIGVRFVAPIDFITTNDNISGYKKEQLAAEQNVQRKLFEQEQQWNDLVARFEDAKTKLSFVEKIEEAQRIKASNERDRLTKGRTVTFQVLNFEQDYAQSELAKIQTETNILNIYSQLKTFSAGVTK